MAHPLSVLGVIHTVLSVPPVVAGLYSFTRYRRIDPATPAGRIYLLGLALSVFTSFGLSSVAGLNPGHVLGVLALLAAFGGVLVPRLALFGGVGAYLSALGFSFSFFLLLVPGINETLTRLPTAHPLAEGPRSPVVQGALLCWLAAFVIGAVLQVRSIRAGRRLAGG